MTDRKMFGMVPATPEVRAFVDEHTRAVYAHIDGVGRVYVGKVRPVIFNGVVPDESTPLWWEGYVRVGESKRKGRDGKGKTEYSVLYNIYDEDSVAGAVIEAYRGTVKK